MGAVLVFFLIVSKIDMNKKWGHPVWKVTRAKGPQFSRGFACVWFEYFNVLMFVHRGGVRGHSRVA